MSGGALLRGQRLPESAAEYRSRMAFLGLLAVTNAFVQTCFHLQRTERALFEMAQRRRSRGRRAVRQIEHERQRLGRELHTGVGQMLAAIRMQLELIGTRLSQPEAAVGEALDRIGKLADEALSQVRSVSHRLHPPEWQRLTLEEALWQLWEISGIPQSFQSDMVIDPLPAEPDLDIKVLIYRALQEALSNLVRHSRATRIQVSLRIREGSLVLSIQDNGVGFDAARFNAKLLEPTGGIGLRSISEQAEELGGKLVVESSPVGTTLEVSVPLHS